MIGISTMIAAREGLTGVGGPGGGGPPQGLPGCGCSCGGGRAWLPAVGVALHCIADTGWLHTRNRSEIDCVGAARPEQMDEQRALYPGRQRPGFSGACLNTRCRNQP